MSAHYAYRLGWRSVRYVCPNLTPHEARAIADAAGPSFVAAEITTWRRAAAAIAQMAEETDHFRTFTEYASGAEYEGRRDLGNTHPGDGRRFKGRASIMVSGRANYAAMSRRFHHDFIAHPTDMAQPGWAFKVGAAWWHDNGCNHLADSGDFLALTERINGGTNGLASRRALWARARHVSLFLVPKRRRP